MIYIVAADGETVQFSVPEVTTPGLSGLAPTKLNFQADLSGPQLNPVVIAT